MPTSEVLLLALTLTPPHSEDFSVLQFEPRSLEQQERTRPISTSGAPEFGNQASEIMLHEMLGFIGLGNMGSRMAKNIVKAGYNVAVHDVNGDAMKIFAGIGVPTKKTPFEVAEESDVGGSEKVYLAAKLLLLSMGKSTIYCGGARNGSAAKICNNLALAVSMLGVSEALALGQSWGIAASVLIGVFNSSSARCWSRVVVMDEAHERSLNTDVLLGILKKEGHLSLLEHKKKHEEEKTAMEEEMENLRRSQADAEIEIEVKEREKRAKQQQRVSLPRLRQGTSTYLRPKKFGL
ncbi:hypothetical protein NL676_036681 [Syzygium grande]|nr:hypothetical protein NL676_036681 [Syzygium grande]